MKKLISEGVKNRRGYVNKTKMSGVFLNKGLIVGSKRKDLAGLILLSGFLLSTHPAQALLSATTVNTIKGTAPYLTFAGGTTKVTNTDELLGIELSNGTSYTKLTNTSTASSPIELPAANQTFNDIKTLIPATLTSVNLSTLIGTPYNQWGDADGDGQEVGGVSATGTLSVSLKDVNNATVNLTETLSGCKSPYTLTLTSTVGSLETQYGDPRITNFNASSATYYISPKTDTPHVCFAKPNLTNNYGTQPEWDGSEGFKVQSLSDPSKNFPRTGFNGAFFDISIVGGTAQSVISATGTTITQGGVTVTLTAQSANVVRVMLTGPSNATSGGTFTPSTFTLKSSPTNEVYNFALSKWFIAKSGNGGGYPAVQSYCSGLSGRYRVPSISEYTNANGSNWTEGLSGWEDNTYARAIGNGKQKAAVEGDDSKGGLFAEWGFTSNQYYTSSDFQSGYYWGAEAFSSTRQHNVLSNYGNINYVNPSNIYNSAACVSP